MNRKIILAATVLGATLAFAGSINIPDTYVFQALFRPWTRTTAQLASASNNLGYVAFDTTKGALIASDGTIWRNATPMAVTADWDFASLGSGAAPCEDTRAVTLPGVTFGAGCTMTGNQGADAGATLVLGVQFYCYPTSANTVKGRACSWAVDGGLNLTDAGYTFHAWN